MNRKITTRLDINIGTKCNIKCKFCYYLDRLDEPYEDIERLVNRLKVYKKNGINKLHITGGEPTLYKHLCDLVKKAKEMGFINIGIITNGIMLKKKSFVSECKDAGVDHFIISLHGPTAEVHDELTGIKGSYSSILKGIENLKEIEIPFNINLVVNRNNFKYLKEFAELMVTIKPIEVAFLYLNPMDYATKNVDKLSEYYSNTIPFLNNAIDILQTSSILVFYKFIPLCIVSKGYEKKLVNLPQALFEDWEWNYQKRFIIHSGFKNYFNRLLNQYKEFSKEQINKLPFKVLLYLSILFQDDYYCKIQTCKDCKYDLICQGINKYYVESYGTEEFSPIAGEKIVYPDFFLYDDHYLKNNMMDKMLNNLLHFFSRNFYKKN